MLLSRKQSRRSGREKGQVWPWGERRVQDARLSCNRSAHKVVPLQYKLLEAEQLKLPWNGAGLAYCLDPGCVRVM